MSRENGIVSRVMVAASFGQFEQLLRSHDWTYSYSDDYSAWTKGQRSMDMINLMAKELAWIDVWRTVDLYNKYGRLGLGKNFSKADEKSFR